MRLIPPPMVVFLMLAAVFAPAATATATAADPPSVPTMAEIQQAYDAGQYQDALKKASQALQLKGNAAQAQAYDRAKLQAIKGESMLRLKQASTAADAFAAAAKESSVEKDAAIYKATALLVRRSPGGNYTPKQPTTRPAPGMTGAGAKPQPISIIEPESRKQAFAALFNDESKPVLAKTESMKRQTSLKPLMESIKQVGELRALELAGTDSDATCQQILSTLGAQANQLMSSAIKSMSENVDKISKQANESSTGTRTRSDGTVDTVVRKRGLTSADQSALRDVMNTCKDIGTACEELAGALQAERAMFTGVLQDAAGLNNRANDVLTADYNPVTTNSRNIPPTRGGTTNPPPQNRPYR